MRSLFNDMGGREERRKGQRKKSEPSFDSEGERELKKDKEEEEEEED